MIKFKNLPPSKKIILCMLLLVGICILYVGYSKPRDCITKKERFFGKNYTIEKCYSPYGLINMNMYIYVYSDDGNLLARHTVEIAKNEDRGVEHEDGETIEADKITYIDDSKKYVVKMPPTWIDWIHARTPVITEGLNKVFTTALLIAINPRVLFVKEFYE